MVRISIFFSHSKNLKKDKNKNTAPAKRISLTLKGFAVPKKDLTVTFTSNSLNPEDSLIYIYTCSVTE